MSRRGEGFASERLAGQEGAGNFLEKYDVVDKPQEFDYGSSVAGRADLANRHYAWLTVPVSDAHAMENCPYLLSNVIYQLILNWRTRETQRLKKKTSSFR